MKQVKIKSIKHVGKAKARNLVVSKNHTFITKNNIAVHNCDSLTSGPQGAQKMLRQLMEDVQGITRFILLANYQKFIIPELISRCQVIEMGSPPAKDIFKFIMGILSKENVVVKNKSIVVDIIKKLYPDIRQILNTVQLNTINGELRNLEKIPTDQYEEIFQSMKDGDIENIRKILRGSSINYNEIYQYLFDNVGEFKSPGDMIIQIGDFLYKHNIVSIKEINFMAMVAYCMKKNFI
jgi:DNA polymerase III delta prime subunit